MINTEKFETLTPITAVLNVPGGSVRFIAADRTDTTVEVRPTDGSKRRDLKAAEQTTVAYADGVLRIETGTTRSQILGPTGSLEITVHLPSGSSVEAKAAAAGLHGTGRLGDVAFDGAYREVELEEVAGVRLAVMAGDVRIGRLGGPAEIRVQKGDIAVAEALSGPVMLRTDYGQVSIGAARGVSATLDAGTGHGRIDNALQNADGADAGLNIHATTGYGDISAHSL